MTLTNNTDKGAIDTNTSDVVIPNGSSGSSRQPEGRISRTGAIVKQQLLNLSYDQYHIHTSSNIALVLFRGIKSTPVRIRKTVAFVRRIRNQLIVLNNYNRATFEAKGKYPYSKALILLLVRYVQLEYDVLYHSENYSAKYEEEVEGKVRHFLYLLLDGVARRYKGLNTDDTATECVLRVLNEVSTEYKVKGRFIYSLINKLAKKLGLLETISEIRQNGILFQNHPAFQKLSCDSIDNISDCESDDACEIPTSPARSCESPFDTLKLQSPKREPPDLDSGQGLKFPFFDDDYDDDSFIYGVHRLKSQQMNLFGPRSEIVDYSSNGDDYIDLITERVNDKSVQNIDNKDDSNCVAIQSTNEHKICRDVTLNRDDHDVAFGCSVYSNNNRPVTVDCPVSRGNKKNTKRSKNNSASSKASPNRIQNSSEVIDLVDNDDVIEVIEFPPATPAVNNARQVPSTSANKVEEIYLVDDDDDCVIIENQEEIPNKFNDEQTSEKRATSDNQVNEISSTTGKEELVFHSTDCPDSSSAKNKDFEDGLAEIPVNAFVNRLTDSLRTTSPEIYEKMNQLEQENGQVHALEDLTPETQGDDVKATLNQSINEKCDENGSETTQRVSSDLGILKSTEFLQMNILEEASKKSRLLEESSGSNSIVDITEPEETIVDQITPVEETTKNEVDVIVIQETISVSTEINLKSSILEVTTPKDTIDLVNNKETKGNITEINEVIDQCVELNRPETVSTMNLSSEFELTTANDISANNLINNEDVPTEIAEVNKISDEGVESNQLNLSSRLEVITSGDVVDDDQIQEIIGEINDVDSNQQQAIPILNSLSVPEICLDTETTDEKLIKLQKSDHHPPGKDEDGSSVFDKIDQSVTPILSQDLNISQNEVVENVVENNTSHNIEPEESFNLPPIQEKMSSDEQFVDAEKLTTEIYQEEPLEANKEKSLQENVIAVAYDVDIEEKIEDNNTILVDAEAQIDNANTQQNYAFVSSLEVTNSLEIEGEEIIEDNTVVLIADETQIEDVTTKQNYTSAWYSEVTDSVKNQSEEKLSISDKFHQTSIIPLDNSADDRSIEREDCEDPVKYANLDYTISPTIEGLNKECNISMEANESNEDPTSKGQNSSEGTKRMLTITDEGNTKLEDNKDEILQSEQIDPEENLISDSQESDVNPPKSILDLHESPIESGSDLANIKVDLTSQISNLIDKEDTELVAIELENVPASSIAENREKMEKALDISREGNVISDLPKIRNDSEFIESKIESYVICEMATPSPQNNIINVTCEDIQLNTIVVANSENIDLSENTEDKIPVLSNQLNEAENNEGTIPVTEILESADIQLEISEDVLHQEESNLRSTISSVEESSICPQESEKGNKLEINLDSSELNIQCETSSSEENSKDVSSVSDLETYREVSRDFLNLEENFKNELLFETRIEVSATVVIQSNNYENLEIESNELSFPPIIIADVNCTNLENGKVDNLDESDLLHLDKTSEESSFDHLLLNKATEANDVEYNEVSVDNTNLENIKESDNSSSNDGSFLLTIDVPENIDHSKDKETIQPDQINDVVFEYTNDGVNLEQVEVADCLTNKNVLPLEQLDKAHLDDVSKDDVKDGDNSINKDELIEKTTNKSEDDYYCDGITVDITESNGDIPIELESETIQNSDTTEIKDFPKEDDGDVNKTYNQNATFDDQEIFLILPTEEIKDNELSEKNEKDEGEGVFYILNTADCEGMNFVIQDDNIGEVNQGEYTTEAIDTSKTSERDLNIEGDIENFNPKDVEYRYDEDIPTTDSEVCVDYCEFQTNQLECDNEVVLGNKEENCVNESVSDVQLCNNETSEVVDNELTSLLADLCVSTTNKQNTTVNTAAIEDINIKEKESTKINEEGCANKRQIENPDVQDKEHFKLPSFITDDAIILTEPQALNFENCVRVLEGVEGYSGDVSDDASLDSDNLEDTSCEIPPDEIKYFPAMNEFPLEDSFRYPIISERSLEESDDSRILEPDIVIEELNTSYIDHSSNFIDPDSSNSSNFIHSTLATEYYNANNLCLPNFIKTELGGEVQDADAIIRESKSYRQSFDVTLSEMENTSSKVEDPYLNLEILATAAAAQKSLKVNPKSALRSRVKMATVKVQKKSEEGFQPNEVIETVTKQPVQTVFASATESDFNTVSEDSCDSFAGKLVIAEDHKARESSPPPVYPEIKLEPEDVTIFDEDTMDEELSLISTNLQEIDNVDVQITIEESEEFVDVFDEIIKFNTDLDDECDEEENDTDDVVKLSTKYDVKDISVDKAGSSKYSKGKKIGENVKKTVTKIKTSKTKQGLSHYYKKVPTTTINLSQTENSSSKLEITDDISIFPEKSAKRNKNIIQKKVPVKPPKKCVGKRKNKIDEPKGLKKIKEKKTLQTEIKEVISQPDEKHDRRLDENKIIIGESPMLTHDGEISQMTDLSEADGKIIIHNTIVDVTTSEVTDNLVKFCDDTMVEEQLFTGEQSIKQPIRTKAELKAYDKKNQSSDKAATTTTEDSNLIENKLNLSSYVKLIRDPHMQKLIDKQYEEVATPRVTLGRKSYKSLIDARKLMFKTHPVQNQVLKNNNILPNIAKIEDGCPKSIGESSLETVQDKNQNLKTNDKLDEDLKISVGSNNKKIDEVCIENQIKEQEEKLKDETEKNPQPELLNKCATTSKTDDLNNQLITATKIVKEPLPKNRKATRSLSIEISKVVFSETNTDSSKTRSSDVEKGKSPKRTQFRRATRSASVDTKTFEKSISSSSIHGNLDKNKMHLANKTSSNSNLAICELNSFNIDKKKEAKSNKCNISDEMAVTSEPISTRRSSREFRRDTLLDRSVANQDDINFKKAQSKLSAIGTTIEEIIVDQNLPSKKKVVNKKPKQKETFAIDSNDNTQKVKVKDLKKSEGKQKRIQEYYGKKLLKPKRLTNEIDIVPVIVDDNKIKLNKYSGGKSKKNNKEKSDLKIITPVVNRKRQAESESRKDENCAKSDTPEVKKSKLAIEKDNSILIKTDSKSNIETNKKKMPIKKSQLIEKRNKSIPGNDSVEKQNVVDSKSKPDKGKTNKIEITAKASSIKRNIDDTKTIPKEKLCSESKNIPADDSIEKQNVIDHKPKPDKGKTNKIEITAKALSTKRNIDDTKTIPKENLCSKSKNIPADDSVEKENVIDSKSKPDKGKTNKIETAAKGLSIERSIDDTKTSPIEKLCSESKNIHADESIEEQNVVDCKSKPDKGKINKIETTAKALSVKRNIDDTKISPNEKLCSESKNILADDSVEKQNVVDFKSKPDKGKTNKIETTAKALSVKRNIDDTKTSLIEKLSSESKNVPADDRIEKEKVIDSESKPDKANTNKMETKAKALSIKRNIDDTKTSPIGELCSGSKNVPGDDSVEKQNVVDFKSKPDKGKTNKIETTAKALSVKRNIDDTKTSPIGEPCSESKNVPEDDSVQRQNVIDSISKPKKEKTNKIETTTKGLSIKRNIDDTETSPIEKLCSESKNVPADDSIEKQNVVDSKTKINKIETTPKGLSSIKRKNTEETKTTSPKEKPCFESKEIIEKVPDSEINVGKIDEKVVIPVAEIVKVNTQEMDKEINPKSEEKCHEIPINLEESIHSQESQKKSEKTLSELPSNNQEEKHAEVVPDKKPKIKKTQNDLSIRNEVNDLEIIPSVENEEIKKQLIRESLEVKSMLKTKNDELLDLDRNIQTEIEDEKEKLLIAENDTTLQTDPAQSEKIFEENGVGKNNISKSTTTDQNSHGLLKEKYIAEDKPEINSICQQHNDLNENIDNFPKKELNEPHITAMSKTLADDSEISGISLRLNSDRDEEPAMKAIGETSREQVEELNIGSMKQSVKENKSALNVPKTCQIKSIMKKAQQGGVDVSDKKKVTFTIDHIMGINTEKTVKNEAQISTADLDLNSSEEGSSKNAENIKICNTQSFSENTTKKSTKYHCGEPKILNFEQRPLDVMITKDLRGTTPPDLPKLKRKLFEDPEIDSKKQKIQTNPKIEIAKLKRLVKDKLEKGNDMITKSQEFNVTSPTKRRDTRKNIDAIINNLRHNLDTKDAEDLLKSNKTKISSKWKDSEQRHEVTVFEIIEEDKSRKAVNEVGIRSEIANDDLNRVREINKMQTSLMDMDGESSSPHITNSESSNAADITTVSQESSASKDSEMITKLQPAQEEGEIKLEKTRLLKDSITLDEEIMLNDFNNKDRQDTISEEMLEDISDRVGKSNVLENTESKNDINSPIEIDTTKETDKNENCKDKIADDPNVATNYIKDDAMDTVKPLTEKMVVDDITTSIDTNSNDNFIKSATKKLIAEEVKNSSFYNLVTCAPLEKLMATTITNDSTNCDDSITPRELEKSINNGNDNSVLSPPDSLVIEKSTDQANIKPSNDFINSLQLRRSNHEEINSASSDCVKSLQSENSIVAEVTNPDLTNSANIDLISEVGANSVVTAEMSNSTVSISDTNETSLEASSIIFEEKQKKPDDILLNFNNNNKSGLFRGMNTDPIATDYNEPIAQLDKTLELKCSPDDPAMPDMSISAASQMTNLIQNDVPWPNVAVCNSFLLNDNFEQQTDDPIPDKIFSNPIKDLNVVCSKPIEYSRPKRIDESDKQNISPCKIQDKTVDVSNLRIKDEDSSSSVVCESGELVAMTTEISPFVSDPILATNAGELNSSVSFANVNPENANSVPGKSFDAIDEDQTSLTENVKVYIQITPGTATDHNYSMGGPLLGGKCENTDLPTKQLRAERDNHGSTEGLDNSPVENDNIFSFSEQVNLIENNLTQEKNRSLNQSPIDANADYPFLNQETQLSSTFMENQDASQQQQDNQISIDYMKLMNLEQECDSDQDGSIISLIEDFSNPMSVETMNDIQLKHSKFIETNNCMNQPFFPLTGLDLADIEGINDTGITTRPFQYGDDHGNSILKEIKQEQLPEKVTVKINEHDFASTDRIKEINCPENPQLSKDDIIGSVQNEMMSNQHRTFTEKAEDNPPKKTNRDSPLTTFSTAMKAKAMADIERKKSEGKRKEIHSGYPIRQNKKTPVLAPIKTASPPLIKNSPFITERNSNSSSPIIKSPRRVQQRQSPYTKEEPVIPVKDQLAITDQKSPIDNKTERMKSIAIEKPKENIKEIVQGKLQDLLSTFSIIKSSNEAPKPPMTKITLDSPTAFGSCEMNSTLYDTVKRKRRQPTERLIDKLSLEILVKGNKNQPKQYCKEPNKPKQYGKDQTKTKRLDKSVGKHLMDYDDSSLSDEPGKFYKRFKKDDNSDDEFLSKPRPRTEDELSRAFDALQKGDDAPKKTDDPKKYENRGLKVGVDDTKISQIPTDLDLKMPTSLHKLPRFYQNKLVPSQPYGPSNVILNSRYQQRDTYRHYQTSRTYSPLNPRDLRYTHTRQPSNSKHLSGGAEVSTRRTNSKPTPDLPCRLRPSLGTNVESDWWRNVNAVIKKPPPVIFAADKKQ